MDGLLCAYGVRSHSSNTTSILGGVTEETNGEMHEWEKWDESNLVLFNRVYHHQEREDGSDEAGHLSCHRLVHTYGKSPLLVRSGVAPQSLVGWGLMI